MKIFCLEIFRLYDNQVNTSYVLVLSANCSIFRVVEGNVKGRDKGKWKSD